MEYTKHDLEAIKKFNQLLEYKVEHEIAWNYFAKKENNFCIPQAKEKIHQFNYPLYSYFCGLVDFAQENQIVKRKISGLKELISKDCETLNKDEKELYIKTLEELINDL